MTLGEEEKIKLVRDSFGLGPIESSTNESGTEGEPVQRYEVETSNENLESVDKAEIHLKSQAHADFWRLPISDVDFSEIEKSAEDEVRTSNMMNTTSDWEDPCSRDDWEISDFEDEEWVHEICKNEEEKVNSSHVGLFSPRHRPFPGFSDESGWLETAESDEKQLSSKREVVIVDIDSSGEEDEQEAQLEMAVVTEEDFGEAVVDEIFEEILQMCMKQVQRNKLRTEIKFSCKDVRATTGFPEKVKFDPTEKTCLSVFISQNIESSLKALRGIPKKVKLEFESRYSPTTTRINLAFNSPDFLKKFRVKLDQIKGVKWKYFELSEADLGLDLDPVLTEEQMLICLAKSRRGKLSRKEQRGKLSSREQQKVYSLLLYASMKQPDFSGTIEVKKGKLRFKFDSATDVNQFLCQIMGPSVSSSFGVFHRMSTSKNSSVIPHPEEFVRFQLGASYFETLKDLSSKYSLKPDIVKKNKNCHEVTIKKNVSRDNLYKLLFGKHKEITTFELRLKIRPEFGNLRFLTPHISEEDLKDEERDRDVDKIASGLNHVENELFRIAKIRDKIHEQDKSRGQTGLISRRNVRFKSQYYYGDVNSMVNVDIIVQDYTSEVADIKEMVRKLADRENVVSVSTQKSDVDLENTVRADVSNVSVLDKDVVAENRRIGIGDSQVVEDQELKDFKVKTREVDLETKQNTKQQNETIVDYIPQHRHEDVALAGVREREHEVNLEEKVGVEADDVASEIDIEEDPQTPIVSFENVLGLRFSAEEGVLEYGSCVIQWLRSFGESIRIFEQDSKVHIKFSSQEILSSSLNRFCINDLQLELPPRARLVKSSKFQGYEMSVQWNLEEESIELAKILRKDFGVKLVIEIDQRIAKAYFNSAVDYIKAFLAPELFTRSEKFIPSAIVFSQFKLPTIEMSNPNFYKGKTCLNESNLFGLTFKSEAKKGYEMCVTLFLADSRIVEVKELNTELLLMFPSIQKLESCLRYHCQPEQDRLSKIIPLHERWKFVPNKEGFALLCPPSVKRENFSKHKGNTRLFTDDEDQKYIAASTKLEIIKVLRDPNLRRLYPTMKIASDNLIANNPLSLLLNAKQSSFDPVNLIMEEFGLEDTNDDEESVLSC